MKKITIAVIVIIVIIGGIYLVTHKSSDQSMAPDNSAQSATQSPAQTTSQSAASPGATNQSPTTASDSVSGTWTWVHTSQSGQDSNYTLKLTTTGGKLTGTVSTETPGIYSPTRTLTSGSFKNGIVALTFTYPSSTAGSTVTQTFSGTLTGNTITGTWKLWSTLNPTPIVRTWTATRTN